MAIITNASTKSILVGSTVPNMAQTLNQWLQPMIFGGITKEVENFQVTETVVEISFMGCWQPWTERQLKIVPEGQRGWRHFSCWSSSDLALNLDDTITYLGNRYRVLGIMDFRLEGYMEYHLTQDYIE